MRRVFGRAIVAFALVLAQQAHSQTAPADPALADPALEAACVVAENNALAGLTELAAGDIAYLVLDMAASEIRFALHGVPLRSFPVLAVEAAVAPEATLNIWQTHRGGVFTPERIENPPEELPLVLEGESESVVQIHLPPEQRFPAPPEFRLNFATGLVIEFHSEEGASSAERGLGARIAGWFGKEPEPLPALRVRMDLAPAGDFYRALPPDIALVIVPACS
jgi:hypothetical protein